MDGAVLSILLTGLLPDVRYTAVVAAVTSLGVGAQSPPVSLLLSESLKTASANTHGEIWQRALKKGLESVQSVCEVLQSVIFFT